MFDTLQRTCNDGGRLLAVEYALFHAGPQFITGIGLRFEGLAVVFRAVEDHDTVAVSVGPLVAAADETIIEVSDRAPWAGCVGKTVNWAWVLTNQQGYQDGVRLEFNETGKSPVVVELLVAASAVRVFVAADAGA